MGTFFAFVTGFAWKGCFLTEVTDVTGALKGSGIIFLSEMSIGLPLFAITGFRTGGVLEVETDESAGVGHGGGGGPDVCDVGVADGVGLGSWCRLSGESGGVNYKHG